MKKVKGSITIYLCIVFLSIIMLISVLAERARVSTIQSKCKAVTYMATESVLAGYGKQVFEDYGLLLAWENVSVEESLKEYMQANINKADLNGTGTNFMDTNMVDVVACKKKYVTGEGKTLFLEQVENYIKYAGLIENAEKLVSIFTNYTESNETKKKEEENDITSVVDKNSDELQSIVNDITEEIKLLKDVEELTEEYAVFKKWKVDQNTKKISRTYKKLIIILEDKSKTVGKIINLINDYKKEKELFLEESGYPDSISDYMEDNLEVLEKLKDKIIEVKKLRVSKISKVDDQSLKEVDLCIEIINDILKSIDELEVNEGTEEDKANISIFESAKKLINKGVIALVTEDTKNISRNAISTLNLPSNLESEKSKENLLDKAKLLTYGNMKFGNYLDSKKSTALKYEIEYLIGGKSSDSDNLAETIKQMIGMRNIVNAGILLTDSQKMGQVTSIATAVAAVTGLPFMEIVAKAVLTEAWALAESIYEVKDILKENSIPVVKTKEDWNTEIDKLLKEPEKGNIKKGIDYKDFCNILLMLQKSETITYRIMDLIQENIQIRYNSEFLMEKCFVAIEVNVNFEIKPLFMAMPWTLSENRGRDTYSYNISLENSY